MCEKDGFIPRYYVSEPQDKVDLMIKDMQDYTRNLITEEMHMGQLIEKAVQNIEADRLREIEQEYDDETEEDALARELFGDEERLTTYEDYSEFSDFTEQQKLIDEALYHALLEGEDN